MKPRILHGLLGGLALSLLSLVSAPAFAAQTCSNPVDGQTSVNLSVTGDCNITSAINVSGTITINVTGGNLTDTAAMSGGSSITITETGGTVTLASVTSTGASGNGTGVQITGDKLVGTSITSAGILKLIANTSSVNFSGAIVTNTLNFEGDVLIKAQTTLATGSINTTGTGNYVGWVDLKAYLGGGTPTPFIIGGTGNANGVNGTITQHTPSSLIGNGLYVINGSGATSVGDIQVKSASSISLIDANWNSGVIALNANNGTITLPSGTISLDGSGATGGSGQFYLLASTISAPTGAKLSANQTSSALAIGHGVWIAADTVSFGGTSGLNLSSSGNSSNITMLPKGAITISDDENVLASFTWGFGVNQNQVGTLTFNGTGSPLTATANGDNSYLTINAYPIVFNSSALSLSALGTTNHGINLGVGGATKTNDRGVTFNVTGASTIDASATAGGNGGQVTFWDDKVNIAGTTFTIKANGPSSGNGNAGVLSLLWNSTVLNASTKATYAANAATAGSGNGGSITYWPGSNLSFGSAAAQFSMSAKGGASGCGTSTPCNGGSVTIVGQDMAFASAQSTAMNVAAGPTGDGGTIDLSGGNITFTGSTYALVANAGTTQGNGGTVKLNAFAALKVGTGAGAVNIAAKGAGTGNGGTVNVTGLPLTLAGANISVAAGTGTGSNANGGNISITSNFGGTITGNLVANGVGTGHGGNITLSGDTPTITGATFTANGGVSGDGGTIGLATSGSSPLSVTGAGTFTASGGATAGSGGTVTFQVAGALNINGPSASVLASGNGNGGTVNLASTGSGSAGIVSVSGALTANGAGSGNGGTISIKGDTLSIASASFTASAQGAGKGGSIILNSTSNSSTSPLSIGSSNQLQATSLGGAGGTVQVSTGSQPIVLAGTGLAVSAGGNGPGGTINLSTLSNSAHAIDITGTVSADGSGTGLGGTISLTASGTGSTDIDLDNATLSASGGASGSGSGNKINISSVTGVSISGTKLNANATGTGTSFGGSISITSAAQVDVTQPGTLISAMGAQNGAGGTVVITNPMSYTTTVDINTVIKVAAGTGAGINIFDGSISLNSGAVCQQIKTGATNSNWPQVYWNCTNPKNTGSPYNAIVSLVQSSQMANVISQLGASNVELYEFSSIVDFNSFFDANEANADGDTGTFSTARTPYVTSSIFPASPTSQNIQEITAHELAHTLDTQSGLTDYTNSIIWDFYYLDFVNGNSSTPRAACTTGSDGKPGPFVGATSENPSLSGAICSGGTLNAKFKTNGVAWSNSKIAYKTSPFYSDYHELYAQAFAEVVYVSTLAATPGQMYNQTFDIVFVENAQFACASSWAANRATGSTAEPANAPTYCITQPPVGYTPGQ